MTVMPAGVTPAGEPFDGAVWRILGQTYTLKQQSDSSMAWDALFPPGTFVPPHIHPDQDEFILMLDGRFDLLIDGTEIQAKTGDLIRLPMGIPHGIFNKSVADVRCFFWVSPTRRLRQLFERIHDVPDPAEVVRIAAEHNVHFLPPPA
jgi:quercetin dioxygenase-like cupin family protein